MTNNRNYFRIMLGGKSRFAQQCIEECWFGGDWGIQQDLTGQLPDNWRDFNAQFIPVYLEANPEKTKVAAGLGCGMLHTICKGIQQGDLRLRRALSVVPHIDFYRYQVDFKLVEGE